MGVGAGALLLALVVILGILAFEILNLTVRLEKRNDMITSELRSNGSEIDFLKQNLLLVARDENSTRSVLKLPQESFPVFQPYPSEAKENDPDDNLFLSGLDALLGDRDTKISESKYQDVLKSPFLGEATGVGGFRRTETGPRTLQFTRDGSTYFTITIDPISQTVKVTDFLGKQYQDLALGARFVDFVRNRTPALDAHFRDLAIAELRFASVLRDPRLRRYLGIRHVVVEPPVEEADSYVAYLTRGGTPLLSVKLDERSLAVMAGTKKYARISEFEDKFVSEIGSFDFRTPQEKLVARSNAELQALTKDKTFMSTLAARRIKFDTHPREDDFFSHYDFTDAGGKRIGSFSVAKGNGTIFILDPDDVSIAALQTPFIESEIESGEMTIPQSIPSVGPLVESQSGLDFVICGEHQGDTDSMMLVHAEPRDGRIVLISLPRDLYYRGEKINSIYEKFGPEELMREISDITGLEIRKYVVIDQYAFVDVVNLLGGIDVYLSSDLTDPTYRVRDNGVWSTLNYAKGMHHLSGIEVLRIARSRHSTSDFVRALRQQVILGAIREKIEQGGLANIGSMYAFIQILHRYVDTNFTPFEMLQFYNRYKDSQISGQHILDMQNVLYHTYSNLYRYGGETTILPEGDSDLGAWILLPKNDNWNLIKWYVRRLIDGATS